MTTFDKFVWFADCNAQASANVDIHLILHRCRLFYVLCSQALSFNHTAPPTSVALTEVTPDSMLLSWAAPTNSAAAKYNVDFVLPTPGTVQSCRGITETKCPLGRLTPFTTYKVTIEACVGGTCSAKVPAEAKTLPKRKILYDWMCLWLDTFDSNTSRLAADIMGCVNEFENEIAKSFLLKSRNVLVPKLH